MNFARSLVIATRRLRTDWVFSLFAMVTLAIGIGSTTAVCAVVYAALFRPLTGVRLDGLASVYHAPPPGSLPTLQFSWPDFEELRAASPGFDSIGGSAIVRQAISVRGVAETVVVEAVTGRYFATLGVEPAAGRLIDEADDRPGATRVVVLSYGRWTRQFGARPEVIGSVVRIGGHPFEVVGVASRRFRGAILSSIMPAELWVPVTAAVETKLSATPSMDPVNRDNRWLIVHGRLSRGVTYQDAARRVALLSAQLDRAAPIGTRSTTNWSYEKRRDWTVLPTANVFLNGQDGRFLTPFALILMVMLILVSLVVASNIGALMLARLSDRSHEIDVRRALGSTRSRLVTHLMVETVLLSAAGGIAGLVVARLAMVPLASRLNVGAGVLVQVEPQLDATAVLVMALAVLGCLAISGFVPAWYATGHEGHARRTRQWSHRWLTAAQIIVSMSLLFLATACSSQLNAYLTRQVGFNLDRLVIVRTALEFQDLPAWKAQELARQTADRLRQDSAVVGVAAASGLPAGLGAMRAHIFIPSSPEKRQPVSLIAAGPGFFEVIGLTMIRGNFLNTDDLPQGVPTVVLSATAARRLFGREDVLGQEVGIAYQASAQLGTEREFRRIVAIAGSTFSASGRGETAEAFVPLSQSRASGVLLAVRTDGDPAELAQRVRSVVQTDDFETETTSVSTGASLRAEQGQLAAVAARLSGPLGVFGLIVALTGVLAQMSHWVTRHSRDVAVRIAVGAENRHILAMLIGRAVRTVGLATLIGFGVGLVVRMAATVVLPDAPIIDAGTLGLVPLPIVGATLVVVWPFRRAALIDPIVALRQL